jgi:hypothetical protein
MVMRWLYRKSDGVFVEGGGFEPTNPDPALFGVVEFGDADVPARTDLFDPATGGKRPMTEAERERFLETPTEVSPLQLKAALLAAGRLQAIEEAVAQADPLTQLAWKEASVFSRTSPLLRQMSASLAIADDEVDAIFRAAGRITV